eukprot:SM000219S06704  [mRNA]  locus=s219:125003:125795:+ [translate_table: standard]
MVVPQKSVGASIKESAHGGMLAEEQQLQTGWKNQNEIISQMIARKQGSVGCWRAAPVRR